MCKIIVLGDREIPSDGDEQMYIQILAARMNYWIEQTVLMSAMQVAMRKSQLEGVEYVVDADECRELALDIRRAVCGNRKSMTFADAMLAVESVLEQARIICDESEELDIREALYYASNV